MPTTRRKPCGDHRIRSRTTNRCRTRCGPDRIRSRRTSRCIKRCTKDQKRNRTTRRCRSTQPKSLRNKPASKKPATKKKPTSSTPSSLRNKPASKKPASKKPASKNTKSWMENFINLNAAQIYKALVLNREDDKIKELQTLGKPWTMIPGGAAKDYTLSKIAHGYAWVRPGASSGAPPKAPSAAPKRQRQRVRPGASSGAPPKAPSAAPTRRSQRVRTPTEKYGFS